MKIIVICGILFAFFSAKSSCVETEPEVGIINGNDATPGEAFFIIQIRLIEQKLHHCAGKLQIFVIIIISEFLFSIRILDHAKLDRHRSTLSTQWHIIPSSACGW